MQGDRFAHFGHIAFPCCQSLARERMEIVAPCLEVVDLYCSFEPQRLRPVANPHALDRLALGAYSFKSNRIGKEFTNLLHPNPPNDVQCSMHNRHLTALRGVMVCLFLSAPTAVMADLADTFHSWSKKIPFLNAELVPYHHPSNEYRPFQFLTPAERKVMDSFYESARAASSSEIDKALEHENPKVRAMAVAALCWTLPPPKLLPRLMAISGDSEASFPFLNLGAISSIRALDDTIVRNEIGVESSVGNFAAAIVSTIMRLSGYDSDPIEQGEFGANAEFRNHYDRYWAERKNRQHCLGWMLIELTRVWGTLDSESRRTDGFNVLRKRIESLPSPEREWYWIYLIEQLPEMFQRHLATEAEEITALKKLGRANVLAFLRRDKISDDPDLNLRSQMHMQATGYGVVLEFVLMNASQVLAKEDANEILQIGRERGWPSWWIAAAGLDPDRADEILREARSRFAADDYYANARREIALALWHHLGDAALEEFADWFFNETPRKRSSNEGRYWIARRMAIPEYRSLFLTIVKDERLNTLDWVTTILLINAANHYTKEPIIAPADMERWLYVYPNSDPPDVRMHDDVQKSAEAQLPVWRKKLGAVRGELQLPPTPGVK